MAAVVHFIPLVVSLAKPPDYSVLNRRVANFGSDEALVQCLVLDSMVPRQRIQLPFGPPVSHVLKEVRDSGGVLAVIGMNRRTGAFLRCGVEGRIESMSPYRASHGFYSSHSTTPQRGFTALDTVLVGGRRFEVLESADTKWPPDRPVFPARVRWLPEQSASAAAIIRSEQLEALAEEWTALVRKGNREREPLQITRVLCDLGPMPAAEDADDRALWVAALINPIPALGVSPECRPAVLEAEDPFERVEVVHRTIVDSIAQLKKRPPGPFEVEPPPTHRG